MGAQKNSQENENQEDELRSCYLGDCKVKELENARGGVVKSNDEEAGGSTGRRLLFAEVTGGMQPCLLILVMGISY